MEKHRLRKLIIISILSSLSFILMLIEFPLPFLPPYLTIDFSDIPAFIGFMLFGGGPGALIVIFKIVLYGLLAASEPVGPIANMLSSFSLLLPIYFVYMRKTSKRSLFMGFIAGTIVLTIMLAVLNYFVLLPMYGLIIDQTDIINNLKIVITAGVIPFNIIKGILFSIVAYVIYLKLLPKLVKL